MLLVCTRTCFVCYARLFCARVMLHGETPCCLMAARAYHSFFLRPEPLRDCSQSAALPPRCADQSERRFRRRRVTAAVHLLGSHVHGTGAASPGGFSLSRVLRCKLKANGWEAARDPPPGAPAEVNGHEVRPPPPGNRRWRGRAPVRCSPAATSSWTRS